MSVSTTTTLHDELRGGFNVAIHRQPASGGQGSGQRSGQGPRAQHQATPFLREADTLVASPAPLADVALRTDADILGATRLATETDRAKGPTGWPPPA